MHREKKIVHYDIKMGNIFLNDKLEPKIADFGLSKFHNAGQTETKCIGAPYYMAPE